LLAGFDQYLLGPGTSDPQIVPPARRKLVSKAAGWISPVVLEGGRVAGVWDLDGDSLAVTVFEEAAPVDHDGLTSEAVRLGAFLGRELGVSVTLA
jgi:hypothetical protein